MLRTRLSGVKLNTAWFRLIGVLLLFTGCYWSRYPDLMETHLVLLDQYAAKLEAFARTEGGVPMEDWAEFTYPLERARDFARIAAQRYPDRASLAAFRGALDRYAALVDDPSSVSGAGAVSAIAQRREALDEAVAETRVQLEREART